MSPFDVIAARAKDDGPARENAASRANQNDIDRATVAAQVAENRLIAISFAKNGL